MDDFEKEALGWELAAYGCIVRGGEDTSEDQVAEAVTPAIAQKIVTCWNECNTDVSDYKSLLLKYIEYIGDCEGVDYITDLDNRHMSDVKFTDDEWGVLEKLSDIVEDDRAS